MGDPRIDWEEVAYQHGFGYDDKKMFETLYPTHSVCELERLFGISHNSITKRLDELGIQKRPRGVNIKSQKGIRQGPKGHYRSKSK